MSELRKCRVCHKPGVAKIRDGGASAWYCRKHLKERYGDIDFKKVLELREKADRKRSE